MFSSTWETDFFEFKAEGGHNVSKHVHRFFSIGLKYYLFVILSFDTASHDTGAVLLANLGESLQDFQVLVVFPIVFHSTLGLFQQ